MAALTLLNAISASRVMLVNPVVLLSQRVTRYLCVCDGCPGLYGKVFTPCRFANHKQIQCKQYFGGGIDGWEFQHAEEWLRKK